MGRSIWRALGAAVTTASLLVATAGSAWADNLDGDGDGVTPVSNNDLAFGTVCAGESVSRTALFVVRRNGAAGSTNVFKNGSSVTVGLLSQGSNSGVPGTVTVSPTAVGTIGLPSDWGSRPNNTLSSSVSTSVTLVAGPTAGALSQSLTFRANGVNASNASINRDDAMTVSATVVACDSTAPVVSVSVPAAPPGQGGYLNANDVPVAVSVTATDPSGVVSIVCHDGLTPITFDQTGSNPRAGSFPLSTDGAHNIACTATDGRGNSGASFGSSSTATVLIDSVGPLVTCGGADGSWHASDISIPCTASDPAGSGLLDPSDADFDLVTAVPPGTETADALTSGRAVADVAGNVTNAGPIGGNKVDRKAPELSACDAPDDVWHTDNVSLTCSYVDGGSGLTDGPIQLHTHVAAGEETSDAPASAGGAVACDAVGNCAASPADIGGNMVDRRVPQLVSCDAPDGAWHPANVTLSCTYADLGSGPLSQTVQLTTSVDDDDETSDAPASAGGAHACDAVGNCAASPADIGGNMVDRKAPTVAMTTPSADGTDAFVLNQSVSASFSCADGGSGLAPSLGCQGPPSVDTTSVGSKSFAVATLDQVGNAGGASSPYAVRYSTGSCLGSPGHRVLQPVNADGSSAFKKGSTVPVKFRVCDALGVSISDPEVVASFKLVRKVSGAVETLVSEDPVSTTPDSVFRWDAAAQQWIYNLSTKGLPGATTYYYEIGLNDGTSIGFHFYLRP